ncbi:MAG: hypothetical protein ACLFRG_00465 [Desulfococcaceae bacterium]
MGGKFHVGGSTRPALANLAHRLFEWNGIRWITFGLLVCANIVEVFQGFQNFSPFFDGNDEGFLPALPVHDAIFMNGKHCLASLGGIPCRFSADFPGSLFKTPNQNPPFRQFGLSERLFSIRFPFETRHFFCVPHIHFMNNHSAFARSEIQCLKPVNLFEKENLCSKNSSWQASWHPSPQKAIPTAHHP